MSGGAAKRKATRLAFAFLRGRRGASDAAQMRGAARLSRAPSAFINGPLNRLRVWLCVCRQTRVYLSVINRMLNGGRPMARPALDDDCARPTVDLRARNYTPWRPAKDTRLAAANRFRLRARPSSGCARADASQNFARAPPSALACHALAKLVRVN